MAALGFMEGSLDVVYNPFRWGRRPRGRPLYDHGSWIMATEKGWIFWKSSYVAIFEWCRFNWYIFKCCAPFPWGGMRCKESMESVRLKGPFLLYGKAGMRSGSPCEEEDDKESERGCIETDMENIVQNFENEY